MTHQQLPKQWATRFGLAAVPLFEESETDVPGSHHVLLDGGFGSFALSLTDEPLWKEPLASEWSWSSNLPHHVTVTEREVAVVRWDKPRPELLTRSSVENQIDAFYSYLSADRVNSSRRVTDHMVAIFRQVRALVSNSGIDDTHSVDLYLAFLAQTLGRQYDEDIGWSSVYRRNEDELKSLPRTGLDALAQEALSGAFGGSLKLHPSLAIRHAGSEIFQEAHFELLRTPSPDLFGYAGPVETKRATRGGAHFTPPALARTIVEQVLDRIPGLHDRRVLTVLDPACGSGAFLHESMRTLRRRGFNGRLKVVGRDISQPAVSMAQFVVEHAYRDWCPQGGCEIDIAQSDALGSALPSADVVVMNPPFVSWTALSQSQRQQMRDVLGESLKGRGDFSMAFVSRALEAVSPGGALGTLLPSSLLTLQAAEEWRGRLLDEANLRFVASLGDYGLFTHALVQVAAAVFEKPRSNGEEPVTALVTDNDPEATGTALRELRKFDTGHSTAARNSSWRIFRTSNGVLRSKPTWRLVDPETEEALDRILSLGSVDQIGNIFDVRQGVRTGANDVFILGERDFRSIPVRERKWFRKAILNESVSDATVSSRHLVFFPYDKDGLALKDERSLAEEVPFYLKKYLSPNKERLASRASIVQSNSMAWWELSRHRSWTLNQEPRLVSKYFGGLGGIAADLEAEHAIVQGFAWIPKASWVEGIVEDSMMDGGNYLSKLLTAYLALFSSKPFNRLLATFSPHVAGGQYDLSPRYVNSIPIPNLAMLVADEVTGRAVLELARLGNEPELAMPEWRRYVNRLATRLYGGDSLAWE